MAGRKKSEIPQLSYWESEDGLILINGWAYDGLICEEIAQKIGISRGQLYRWMKQSPAITKAIKDNGEIADRKVEQALLKRALGFEFTETAETRTAIYNKQGKPTGKISVKKTTTTKTIIPDVTAERLWLYNRKPGKWRDNHNMTGDDKKDLFDFDYDNEPKK